MFNAPNVLLMGDSGTGKTYSIRTLIEAGIKPFIIFTEPGMEVLGDLPEGSYHWLYVSPTTANWKALIQMADAVNKFDYKTLTTMSDKSKKEYKQILSVLEACNDFTCECCGESFGDVAEWDTDRALVIDSLSGLGTMAMQLHIGGKLAKDQKDWGLAQDLIRKILNTICGNLHCWFVLIAHLDRTQDQVTGGVITTVHTLGQKLAPDIPKIFSDVIEVRRNEMDFTWNTAGRNIATKARNLPIAPKQVPSFVPLAKRWEERGGKIGGNKE